MEAASCHRLSPIYSNINQPCSLSTLSLLYVGRFLLQTTYGTVLQNFVSLLGLKVHDLGTQTQRKPENTDYLSTLTSFLWYLTVMQTLLLCIQTIFVIWGNLRRKSTAYWSCCNAKLCFCSFSIRSNQKQFQRLIDQTR